MIGSYTEQTYPDRGAWLAARRQTIGGSDAPVILGLSKWQSPAGLYAEKLGLVAPSEDQTEAQEMGLMLEPVIREIYQERTGHVTVAPSRPWMVRRSSLHPFMSYSPDGFVFDGARGRGPEGWGVFQAKTASAWSGREWEDEPPLGYLVQLQHELVVEGATWGVLAVLIGGQRFLYFEVERHERLIAGLIEKEAVFAESLRTKTPPEVDGSAACSEMLRGLYPQDEGAVVDLPADAEGWDARLENAKQRKREAEANIEEYTNRIKAAMGPASVGVLPGGQISYTWRSTTYKYKAQEAREEVRRVLRRREEQ